MKIENTSEAPADALAHLLGLTARQVQRLVKTGVIPRTARGHYDLPAAVQAWGSYLAQGKTTAELGTERRRLVAAQAYRAESENRLRDGELLDAADVKIVLCEAASIIATGLDALGGRMAAELAGINDPAIVRQRLFAETRRLRSAMADKIAALAAMADGGPDPRIAPVKKQGPVSKRKARAAVKRR